MAEDASKHSLLPKAEPVSGVEEGAAPSRDPEALKRLDYGVYGSCSDIST